MARDSLIHINKSCRRPRRLVAGYRRSSSVRANHLFSRTALGLWCAGALALGMWSPGAVPQSNDQVQELQAQVDALNRELARLKARDPAAQRQAMENHWSMMQDHMQSTRQMSGMGVRNCGDRMMIDPGMVDGGMMGARMMNCTMMGHGIGMGAPGWALPSGMAPDAYRQQMEGHMQRMRSQMSRISAETNPGKRQALMREHYETMYRDMQTMRGLGWMWGTVGAASLPDPDSAGAKLVSQYCGQCHVPPSPSLHTRSEWSQVTQRMRAHIGEQAGAAGAGVLVPRTAELDALTDYLGEHAKAEH